MCDVREPSLFRTWSLVGGCGGQAASVSVIILIYYFAKDFLTHLLRHSIPVILRLHGLSGIGHQLFLGASNILNRRSNLLWASALPPKRLVLLFGLCASSSTKSLTHRHLKQSPASGHAPAESTELPSPSRRLGCTKISLTIVLRYFWHIVALKLSLKICSLAYTLALQPKPWYGFIGSRRQSKNVHSLAKRQRSAPCINSF